MDALWNDLRHAARMLARSRGFAAVAILTLALGIGANTAIFSIVNSVLLRPLAYRQPERLVMLREIVQPIAHLYPTLPMNLTHYLEWRKRASGLEQIAVLKWSSINLTGSGEPEQLSGARVSANLFALLGVEPQFGHRFFEEEDQAGRDRVVILTQSLWKRRFGSDPALVGKTITLDGNAHVVAGILPGSFRFAAMHQLVPFLGKTPAVEVFRPLGLSPDQMNPVGEFDWAAIARLKPGITPDQALAELNVIQSDLGRQHSMELRAWMLPLQEQVVGASQRGLVVLQVAVGAVLLIISVNLANLLLARASGRSREWAIRTALGASRGRLVRQLLTETLLLAAIGGALGVALSFWGLNALVKAAPVDLPRLDEVRLDGRALGFALLVSIATGLLFGLLPALRVSAAAPVEGLKAGSRGMTEGPRAARTRGLLVSLEVGLSAVLLITAGLLLTSFVRLLNVNKGFEVQNVVAVDVSLPFTKYKDGKARNRFHDQVLAGVEALPVVRSAGLVSALPLQGESHVDIILLEGDNRPLLETPLANYRFISPGYFKTVAIPLLRGRAFEPTDRDRNVAIISERVAQRVWPNENPLGKRFRYGGASRPLNEVVGVVGDVRTISLEKQPPLMVYVPYWKGSRYQWSLVLRTTVDPRAIAPAIRAEVWKADRDVPVPEIRTMERVMAESVGPRRFHMSLVVLFGAAALLLAALGIYGVVSYSVVRRTSEIGIRMALGARPANVLGMVLGQGLQPVIVGLIAGVAVALAIGRAISSLLFGVSAADPLTIAIVVAMLTFVAAAACYFPGHRAARIDPAVALRAE